MINSICLKIAEALGRKLVANDDQVAVYGYALEILLGTIIKLILIIVLSSLFDILNTTLVFLFTFAIFRWLGGGVHLSTYFRCLTFGLLLVLGMGYAATLPADKLFLIGLYLLSASAAVYVVIRWIPAGTDKKQVFDTHKRLKQKKETLGALIVWSILVITCIFHNHYAYALAAILGSLWSFFFMVPMGYRFIGTVDSILAIPGQGGEIVG